MRPHEMSVAEAVDDLEKNGSSEDPITFQLKEIAPSDLPYKCNELGMAKDLRIEYQGKNGPTKGTLSGMVRDRRSVERKRSPLKLVVDERLEDLWGPCGTLEWWQDLIADLIEVHGPEAEMHIDVCRSHDPKLEIS